MPETRETITLDDFAMSFLAGLIRQRITVLNVMDESTIHEGVVKAYEVVREELGDDVVTFYMTTNYHGLSGDVYSMFRSYMRFGYATLDSPDNTPFRFNMSLDEATRRFDTVVGSNELYDKAVSAFLEYIRDPANHPSR